MTERFRFTFKFKEEKIMMRSLYSGVAGLKTHQTKMDVIVITSQIQIQLVLNPAVSIFQIHSIRLYQVHQEQMQN